MQSLLPAVLHRTLMPLAHLIRHYWRRWRKTPIAGVSIVITNLTGDVLLLKHSYGPEVWSLPGGGLGVVLVAHQHGHLRAQRAAVEVQGLFAAAFKHQIGLDFHGGLLAGVGSKKGVGAQL